jgi:hypothetical protein
MSNTKAMYRTILADHFPPEMTITFGDQKLVYRKRTWKIPDPKAGRSSKAGCAMGRTRTRRRPSMSWWGATSPWETAGSWSPAWGW